MNYKRMWLSLKKIVSEEVKVFRYYNQDYYKGQEEEADYILDQMEIIEVRETLLQEKEKDEGKIEDH